jgi:hypothetical protein
MPMTEVSVTVGPGSAVAATSRARTPVAIRSAAVGTRGVARVAPVAVGDLVAHVATAAGLHDVVRPAGEAFVVAPGLMAEAWERARRGEPSPESFGGRSPASTTTSPILTVGSRVARVRVLRRDGTGVAGGELTWVAGAQGTWNIDRTANDAVTLTPLSPADAVAGLVALLP